MGNESRKRAAEQRQHAIRLKSRALQRSGCSIRFVADVMLGRLAKWLRIAGFDVLYSNRFNDDEIIVLAQREERTILSRDTRLLVRKSVKSFIFLESEKIEDQIRQIFLAMQVTRLPALLGRCVRCNQVLAEAPLEAVRETVPPFVCRTQTRFKVCPDCRKVYWAGTHRQSIIKVLERLMAR